MTWVGWSHQDVWAPRSDFELKGHWDQKGGGRGGHNETPWTSPESLPSKSGYLPTKRKTDQISGGGSLMCLVNSKTGRWSKEPMVSRHLSGVFRHMLRVSVPRLSIKLIRDNWRKIYTVKLSSLIVSSTWAEKREIGIPVFGLQWIKGTLRKYACAGEEGFCKIKLAGNFCQQFTVPSVCGRALHIWEQEWARM